MNVYSEIEFPPLEACLKSPLHVESSNDITPSEALNSSLNPSAQVFTPRSSINISVCLGTSTPETIPEANVEMYTVASIGRSGDRALSEKNSQNSSKYRFNKRKNASNGKPLSGKRKLSMTSIANTTVSSIDTNISDSMENENDADVLSRREKNIRYGKSTEAYERYVQVIPKQHRIRTSPRTPIKEMRYSRRQWDGLIKHWKLRLHSWDQDANRVEVNPRFSTPKRPKIKCDRRSVGKNNISPVRTIGDMLPPSIKMMLSRDEDMGQDEMQNEENVDTDVIDWSKPSSIPRIMDWSKECEASDDETDLNISQVKECTGSNDLQPTADSEIVDCSHPTSTQTMDLSNICSNSENKLDLDRQVQHVSKNEHGPSGPQNENTNVQREEAKEISKNENIAADAKSSSKLPEEEGVVYKCVSLVEAIAAFDDKTYNEEEDEDYVPPEERGLKLEEIGLDASDDDSDSDPDTLFYQIVQRNQPYRSK